MLRILCGVTSALVVTTLVSGPAASGEKPAGTNKSVTFTEHIAPIVFNNCTGCHRPDEAAPFTVMNYRDVRKRGRMIRFLQSWSLHQVGHRRKQQAHDDVQHPWTSNAQSVGVGGGSPRGARAHPENDDQEPDRCKRRRRVGCHCV